MEKEEKEKAKEAAGRLSEHLGGTHVGSAYGLFNRDDDDSQWFLIVWCDLKIAFPGTWEGYPVKKQEIPRIM